MTYIVNATDTTRPLNTDPRKQGAEELRALKLRVNQLQSTLEGADSTNASAAAAALAAANAAQGSANAAQGSANAAASAAAAAQGTAASALNLAQAMAFKNVVQLTGSGNWTVPAGVPQVLALLYSGGTASGSKDFYTFHPDFGSNYYTVDFVAQIVGHNAKLIYVTAGQVISYVCGAGDVVRTDYGSIYEHSPNLLQSVAQATTFGANYAWPATPNTYQGFAAANDVYAVPRTRQRQATLRYAVRLDDVHTGTWFDGEAGRIVLFY